jgi:hypothetical protein
MPIAAFLFYLPYLRPDNPNTPNPNNPKYPALLYLPYPSPGNPNNPFNPKYPNNPNFYLPCLSPNVSGHKFSFHPLSAGTPYKELKALQRNIGGYSGI